MSKSLLFKEKLAAYGTIVSLIPLGTNKCSCWKNGWPDKDHVPCNGTGYLDAGDPLVVKAFTFPAQRSQRGYHIDPKEYHMDMGIAKAGNCKCYFSPDIDLYDYEKVEWEGIIYRLSDRDRIAIDDEIIYKTCTAERIN